MKELDHSTAALVRWLAEDRERLFHQYRVKPVVLWIGGDPQVLAEWAQRHGFGDFPLAVVPLEQQEFEAWRIDLRRGNTTILLRRPGIPVANLLDILPADARFESALETHFP